MQNHLKDATSQENQLHVGSVLVMHLRAILIKKSKLFVNGIIRKEKRDNSVWRKYVNGVYKNCVALSYIVVK